MLARAVRISLLSFGVLLAAPAASAPAASVWTQCQELSPQNFAGEVPQVAIADDGTALVAWLQDTGGVPQVRVSRRARGGSFDQTAGVSFAIQPSPNRPRPWIRLKMNRRGDAIVVWESLEPNGRVGIRSNYRPAGGSFGRDQVVISASNSSFVEPEVALDGQGRATVIFHRPPVAFNQNPGPTGSSIYSSRTRSAGSAGTWSTTSVDLIPHEPGSEPSPVAYNETEGSISVTDGGDRLAVITSQKYSNAGRETQRIYSVGMRADQVTWQDGGSFDDTSTGDYEATDIQTASSDLGTAATWSETAFAMFGTRGTGPRRINGSASATDNRSGSGLVIDSTGDALSLWSDGRSLFANQATRSAQAFGTSPRQTPVPVGSGSRARTRPVLAADDGGSVLAVFQERASQLDSVQAASRAPGGSTAFEAPTDIARLPCATEPPGAGDPGDPGDLENDESTKKRTGPRVAMNGVGEAVAAWARTDDGGQFVVQTSLRVPLDPPAGVTIPIPPTPPPRPPAPAPSVIEVARPLKRGAAVVLTANVAGPVERLEWSFGSKGEPDVVGRVVNGRLQRSVRLRLPDRSFEASVRAVGPGGSTLSSRRFATPKPSEESGPARVLRALTRQTPPPVFAVGDADTLTGQSSSCSTMTIWAGAQKVSGCFKPIEAIADIPGPERGVLDTLATKLGLSVADTGLMQSAVGLTDSYVAPGRILLNDEYPVSPRSGASMVFAPQAEGLVSARASLPVGGGAFNPSGGFNLKLAPENRKIALGKLPDPPKIPAVGGLQVVGDWNVNLDGKEATIKASVQFPSAIRKAGVGLANEVELRATKDRVIVDSMRVGPIDVNIASLAVNRFQIAYSRAGDEWRGQGKACVIASACLDMIPPAGGVVIKNGTLSQAGATLQFPGRGLPLFAGVNLERVGFGIGLRPTRINGSAQVGVAELLKLRGRVLMAFPDSANPFVLTREEAGDGFPGQLYGQRFTRTTLGASAEALLEIPVIGETRLASAYALYEYPGYAAFGGGFNVNVLAVVDISGRLDAEADFDRGLYNLHGRVQACINLVDDLCAGVTANVSRGAGGSGGAGACANVGPVNIGGGVLWRGPEVKLWPLDGCKWSRFRTVVRSSVAQATGRTTVTVKKGEPGKAVQLDGTGAAPFIRITGPGGQRVESNAGSGLVQGSGGAIRIMRHESPLAKRTVVGFQDARPGTYVIETLPGSASITSVKQAEDPPEAKASGRVTGKERRRVLTYEVGRRPGQKVTFYEIAAGGAAKRIGATAGGRGRMRFTAAPGRGRRRVVAQFELSGLPAERRQVATFTPQSPVLATPKNVKVRRTGSRLLVTWRPVRGARRYEVAGSLSSRRQVFATSRRGRATLRGAAPWLSGRVTVRAVDDLRQSRLAGKRFKSTGKRPTPFRALPRCKVAKKRISCGRKKAVKRKRAAPKRGRR